MSRDALAGCLLGGAVGDALGLPYEGLSSERGGRLFPDRRRHHLLPGRGMVSDDTEHACFTARALIGSGGELESFQRALGRSLRWWFAGLPAGVGFATARAILKLWVGVSPARSGVHSAGNGPAMRAAVLGVALGDDPERLQAFVRASTEITHRDPKAYVAALAVALAARSAADGETSAEGYLTAFETLVQSEDATEFLELLRQARRSAAEGETVAQFAEAIGSPRGVSGYSFHTVPCVLQAWFRHGADFETGLLDVLEAGGDTDTAGAIFGGIAGAGAGKAAIPGPWLEGIVEWPRSITWIEALATALARWCDGVADARSPGYCWPAVPLRNLLFLIIVLLHGFRRLLPPYPARNM